MYPNGHYFDTSQDPQVGNPWYRAKLEVLFLSIYKRRRFFLTFEPEQFRAAILNLIDPYPWVYEKCHILLTMIDLSVCRYQRVETRLFRAKLEAQFLST